MNSWTRLYPAAQSGHLNVVYCVVYGWTRLHQATENGHLDVVERLLQATLHRCMAGLSGSNLIVRDRLDRPSNRSGSRRSGRHIYRRSVAVSVNAFVVVAGKMANGQPLLLLPLLPPLL